MTVEETVADRLGTIVRLLAVLAIRDFDQQQDKIIALSKAGMQSKEIADLLDTTPHTVAVTVSAARTANKSRARKKPKK
jgi:DNA-binding CsgD family transcriptional regulator